jgi:hypothetical protein
MGGEAITTESNEDQLPPHGVVGVFQIECEWNVGFDGGNEGGGGRVRVCGGRGVDGLAHLSGTAIEFILARLEDAFTALQLLLDLLEIIGSHGSVRVGFVVARQEGGRVLGFLGFGEGK